MDVAGYSDESATCRDAAVLEGIETILQAVNRNIEESDLQWRAFQRVATECLDQVYDLVDLVYPHCAASVITPRSVVMGSWEEESEPQPCHVERWNRGYLTVLVRKASLHVFSE